MASVQMDDEDLFARHPRPALLKVPLEVREGETGEQDLLDFTEGARAPAAQLDRILDPGLGLRRVGGGGLLQRGVAQPLRADVRRRAAADMKSDGGARWRAAVTRLLETGQRWWDNKLTPNITRAVTRILRQASSRRAWS